LYAFSTILTDYLLHFKSISFVPALIFVSSTLSELAQDFSELLNHPPASMFAAQAPSLLHPLVSAPPVSTCLFLPEAFCARSHRRPLEPRSLRDSAWWLRGGVEACSSVLQWQ